MTNLLVKIATRLPQIKKLIEHREQLIAELDKVVGYNEDLEEQRDHFAGELHKIDEYKGKLENEVRQLRAELDEIKKFGIPGHFSSTIPSLAEIREKEDKIFGEPPRVLPGIDMKVDEQLSLVNELKGYYKDLPFEADKKEGLRYFYDNPSYSYSDAIFLYSMIRHLEPVKIIEVGGGFSSCVILDTNEIFFNNEIDCAFIEPSPGRMLSMLKDNDREKIKIIEKKLQDVELSVFDKLDENDILFVDSSHVSKINSDVNYLFFEILPSLKSGVCVHIHDIFYPFEYPKEWIYKGWAWNENYILRAFLQYNDSFRIILFNTLLENFHEEFFENEMPLCLENRGGSIWIRKL